jgi:hypothetical protein
MPHFLIIGAQKAGTTSLYYYLRQHPSVIPAIRKEIHFFDRYYRQGEAWYRAMFPLESKCRSSVDDGSGKAITGEATPCYLLHPLAPQRVHKANPDAKLIILLRDPIERAFSQYHHEVRKGHESRTFGQALAAEEETIQRELEKIEHDEFFDSFALSHSSYLTRSRYAELIKKWFRYFDRDRVLILESKELSKNTKETLEKVCDFLDLSYFSPKKQRRRNVGTYEPMDDSMKKQLIDYFEPHNKELVKLLGREFSWS